jgi:tetratricopeptide (TPR) repeat protein
LDKAEEMISNVIQLEPSNATYLDTYAWVLFKRGKYMEALFIIEQAIENGGDTMGVVLEHYGDILYKVGNKEEALKYWKMALKAMMKYQLC